MSNAPPAPSATRIIKRYSNRKLYDTRDSRYVTLQQIGEMVRRGEDVQVIDNKTKEDKTEATLALILSEDLKSKPRSVPLAALRTLIQERSDRLMSQLREGPLGRLIPVTEDGAEGEVAAGSAPPPSEASAQVAAAADGVVEQGAPEDKRQNPAVQRINEFMESSRHTLDQLQARVDESVRAIPGVAQLHELRASIQALEARIDAIENMLKSQDDAP